MKKIVKIISIFCLTAMMLSVAACGDEKPNDVPADNPGVVQNDGANSAAGSKYSFSYYGTNIAVKDEASSILGAIGEPLSYFEAPSCAFEGLDKTYTYVDFVLITYPDGDIDRVSTIRLTADTVSTAEGIAIGSSLEDVIAAYGDGYVQDVNSYTYTSGSTKLMFIIENGVVNSVTYSMAE